MNEFQALMGLLNLDCVNQEISKRQQKAKLYCDYLNQIPGIKLLPYDYDKIKQNYAYFPIVLTEEYGLTRDELAVKLQECNIFPRKYFFPLVTDFACYRGKFREEILQMQNISPIECYVCQFGEK